MPLKIGVLVPNSNYLPFLARDLTQALELGLANNASIDYQLFIEPAGYNADKKSLNEKIQQLLIKHQVDVVTAPLNPGILKDIKEQFSGQQIPLIVNTLGEDVVNHDALDPYLFINSFNLWQSHWMAGYWGAGKYGKKAATAVCLHEGGYGMAFAFGLGLEAREGQLMATAVTHQNTRDEDPSEQLAMITEGDPEFIMGLYAGKEAISFLQSFYKQGYDKQFPLLASPFLVGESIPEELRGQFLGVKSISCWNKDSQQSREFSQMFSDSTGRRTNAYTLLAYETGQLINQALRQIGTDNFSSRQLLDALNKVKIEGPRGSISFNSNTKEVETTDYLQEVASDEQGQLYNKTIQPLETPALYYEQLSLARKNIAKMGWLNPYLIA